MVSMHDVARHAGVSQRTVSNVVTGAVHVAPATRARVEASIRAIGYRPNVAARRLRSGRTGAVTLAIPGFAERYFADLAEAVIRCARSVGVDVLVETTGGEHDREVEILAGRSGLLTDGVIMSAVRIGPSDEQVARAEYPLVLVGDYEFAGPIDHVGIPNRKAARAATRHLIDQGRRRIAVLGALVPTTSSSSLRIQGYRQALSEAHIAWDPELVVQCTWSREAGRTATDLLLGRSDDPPDAIFALNDSLALGALNSLSRRNISVPESVAVVGFDDVLEAQHSVPTLTSVGPSLDDIARHALDMLSSQYKPASDRVAVHRHVPFSLQIRESSST